MILFEEDRELSSPRESTARWIPWAYAFLVVLIYILAHLGSGEPLP